MNPSASILTVSGILFGFLFAGYWWALNRELSFEPKERHFKFGYVILIITMGLLGYFGIVLPLQDLADVNPNLISSYRGISLALIGIFGYMLTEFGHYSIFQRQIYTKKLEWIFFFITIIVIITFALFWWVFN